MKTNLLHARLVFWHAALVAVVAGLLFATPVVTADTTVGDADSYIIQVDTNDGGAGQFRVEDFDGGNPTVTVITSDAVTTTINSTTTSITNNATVGGTLGVTGNTSLSTLSTSGLATLNSASITNNATVGGTLGVTGATTLNGATTVNNTLSVDSNGGAAGGNTLVVNGSGASMTVLNSGTGIAHGLFIGQSSTVLTGGTTSTSLTLDDNGATFANTATGGPARVTGVANGVNPFDAVNVSQLNSQISSVNRHIDNVAKKSYGGIASVAALAGIPGPIDNKRFSLGIGYGNYAGENAVALGAKANLLNSVGLTLGLGFSNSRTAASMGAGFSW